MNFDTSDEQELLQDTVRQFLEGECPAPRVREIFDGLLADYTGGLGAEIERLRDEL